MPRSIRRVVTGHNAQGRAVFISDGPAPAVFDRGPGATAVTELWETRATPASNVGHDDPTVGQPQRLPPPKNGSKFRVVEYPPDSQRIAALHGTSHDSKAEGYVRDLANKRHPGFHKTDTIDYAIVLSGEIYALIDEGEVLLKSGDVLIQRGTNHAWSNRTEQACCIAFVLIDAEPVQIQVMPTHRSSSPGLTRRSRYRIEMAETTSPAMTLRGRGRVATPPWRSLGSTASPRPAPCGCVRSPRARS